MNDQNILDVISTISANGESGRLEIIAGATQAELSFRDGKLVDARVGRLTGFQAVNAVAALHPTWVSFDPAFAPLASSSITASERVVLKQFFGIDTVAPTVYDTAVVDESIVDDSEDVTLVTSSASDAELPSPLPFVPEPEVKTPSPSYAPAQSFSYHRALALAVLVITVAAAAAAVIFMSRQHRAPASVAATVESSSPSAPATTAPASASTAPESTAARQDLTGDWNIVNTVETTSYQSFKNMKMGFALSIRQTGTSFSGKGQKISENGRSLPASSRTPIQVQGSINGDRVEATFIEEGTARKTNGRFIWRIDKTGGLSGNFATTAARSSGKSAARREL